MPLTEVVDDEHVGRSAMRKATWHLIPLIGVGYGVAYMDRINISFAALQMNADLHFSATVYGWGAGIFFLSYAACEIPSNLLMHRIGARRWLARIMITWGLLAMSMMFVHSAWQFYAMRFLLGMAEAGFFPGVLYYLCQWFPANLRARTISRFYVSLPLSAVLMGGIAGTILNLAGTLGLRGWQWLFLIEGFPAVLLSAVFLKLLPDSPGQARWLTEDERTWIQTRLASECGSASDGHASDVKTALTDSRVWLFGVVNLLMLGAGYGYTFFAPAIIQNLTHLDIGKVGYIISGLGLLGAAGMLVNAWLSDRTGKRYLHILVPAIVEACCFMWIALTLNPCIALPCIALMFFAHNSMQGPLLATPTTFLQGRGAAAGLAAINMIGILGGLIYPSLMGWIRDRTGSHQIGFGILALTMLAASAVVWMLQAMAHRAQRTPSTIRETPGHVHP